MSRYDADTAIKAPARNWTGKALAPQEEIELAARKKGDKKAREQMIKANLRCRRIAREYDGIGLPLLELISQSNISA